MPKILTDTMKNAELLNRVLSVMGIAPSKAAHIGVGAIPGTRFEFLCRGQRPARRRFEFVRSLNSCHEPTNARRAQLVKERFDRVLPYVARHRKGDQLVHYVGVFVPIPAIIDEHFFAAMANIAILARDCVDVTTI